MQDAAHPIQGQNDRLPMHVTVYMILLDMQQQSKIVCAGHCLDSRTQSEKRGSADHVDHEGYSFARVLGICVAWAQVKEVGPGSVSNGLA